MSARYNLRPRTTGPDGSMKVADTPSKQKHIDTTKKADGSKGPAKPKDTTLYGGQVLYTVGPLVLMLGCPPFTFFLWYTTVHLNGNITTLASQLVSQGTDVAVIASQYWGTVIAPYICGNRNVYVFWAVMGLIQLVLLAVVPCEKMDGPTTPTGFTPKHRLNGWWSFVITSVGYNVLAFYGIGGFKGSFLYENLGELIGSGTVVSVALCFLLHLKGALAPSSDDSAGSGNIVFDFYFGRELYPSLWGLQLKVWIHSRLGMMVWQLVVLSCLHAQYEKWGEVCPAMWVSAGMQVFFIAKHFWWEQGYMGTTDIVHDNEGFYLAYGCIVFMFATFPLSSFYLIQNPQLKQSIATAITCAVISFGASMANYNCDSQKVVFRASNGKCDIWGRPAQYIKAAYVGDDGKKRHSLLLYSGWWGVARHIHYVFDVVMVTAWTWPAAYPWDVPLIYFYSVFLMLLFIDRAWRDDIRCRRKYGKYWDQYCEHVPYLLIPYVV
eukprot:GFYU01019304.1.p1 GENE.GFYU01019304.1~~GFYU01019304.1.p1  ORF type:complete len:493 (-),score=113.83 GFYU01019304.1:77-1555(-)